MSETQAQLRLRIATRSDNADKKRVYQQESIQKKQCQNLHFGTAPPT